MTRENRFISHTSIDEAEKMAEQVDGLSVRVDAIDPEVALAGLQRVKSDILPLLRQIPHELRHAAILGPVFTSLAVMVAQGSGFEPQAFLESVVEEMAAVGYLKDGSTEHCQDCDVKACTRRTLH